MKLLSCTYQQTIDDIDCHEKEVSYREALLAFDEFPWEQELKSLEEDDMSGSFALSKGDELDIHTSINIYIVEKEKVSIALDVCAKKGFLGVFGANKLTKDLGYISHSEAKKIISNIFYYDEAMLIEEYQDWKGSA